MEINNKRNENFENQNQENKEKKNIKVVKKKYVKNSNNKINDIDNIYFFDTPYYNYYTEETKDETNDYYDNSNLTNYCFYTKIEEKKDIYENKIKPQFLYIDNTYDDFLINDELEEDEKRIEINKGITLQKNTNKQKLIITNILKTYYLYNNKKKVEIDLTLKPINLNPKQFFNKYTYQIPGYSIITKVSSNNKEIKYSYKDNKLTINFHLQNEEELNLKIKYTQIKLSKIYKLIFTENISLGIYENTNNTYGKIRVYIKKPYLIYKFSKGNLLKSNYDYYFWEGIIPKGGLNDTVYITLNKTKWELNIEKKFKLTQNGSSITIPEIFYGQNNKILNFSISSSRSFNINNYNIIHDIQNKKYILNFPIGRGNKNAFIKIKILLKNKTYKNWNGENFISDLNMKEYEKYKNLTLEILNNSKEKKPKYYKIGKWIKQNIKYDKSYLQKKMSIDEILNIKKGVCVHFTKLYNALLMSIGIPALHVVGHCYIEDKENTIGHAWSLIKYKNKWIPLDATMGNFTCIVPCCNVYFGITKHVGVVQSNNLSVNVFGDLKLVFVDDLS